MFEIQEFFIEGRKKKQSHVLIHISEPSEEDSEKGYFFAFCEITNGTIAQIEHLQSVINDLESGYYEGVNNKEGGVFEETLSYINRRTHTVLDEKNNNIHCFVGILIENKLTFTVHNKPFAQVIYKKNNSWNSIDLTQGYDEGSTQLFSAITEGTIRPHDYFFLGSPSITSVLPENTLHSIITTNNTLKAIASIEAHIKQQKPDNAFGGMLIHQQPNKVTQKPSSNTKEKLTKEPTLKKKGAQRNTFFTCLQQTLSGQTKKRNYTNPQQKRSNYHAKKRNQQTRPLSEQVLITTGKTLVFLGTLLFLSIKHILFFTGSVLRNTYLITTNHGGQRGIVIDNIKQTFQDKKRTIHELPLLSKVLFLLTLSFTIIFICSISYIRFQEERAAKKQQYAQQISSIKDKKSAAEASLIYENDDKAFTLLQEALTLATALPDSRKGEKEKKNQLLESINSLLDKQRKITDISPTQIADIAQANTKAQAIQLAKINDTLIAFDTNESYYYEIQNNGTVRQKDDAAAAQVIAVNTPKENDKVILLKDAGTVAEYNPTSKSISSKEIFYPLSNTQIAGLFIYNKRLYTLNPVENQIYKHNETQTGYDKGTSWIQSLETDITKGVSLAIDGNVYVLQSNGSITKLTKGKEESFTIHNLDPVLTSPTYLWTYNEVPHLYILEPKQKRIVVLDKTGNLVTQYTSDMWNNPVSMVVDQDTQKIFILDSNKVYSFTITQ
ncbi:MAG: hypothetical protein CL685_01760 [Candidatus Magasanikbacteria bacterium]|nr:hypothetical protein [Candidatus Magasanikbacteria bacterium]